MKIDKLHIKLLFVLFVLATTVQAQDTLSTYQIVDRQQQFENIFRKEYYYNPAHMQDYSVYSNSVFAISYDKQTNDFYRLQAGDELEGFKVETASYKKLKNNRTVWGSAKYTNQVQRGVQWNDVVDLDIVGPYVMADSTRGTNKFEGYEFTGGYAKQINNWTIGTGIAYQAHLSYRDRDPRPKSISSLMKFKAGMSYRMYKEWESGIYAEVNKYTQNVSVKYANQVTQTPLYQMQGLGEYSYYFSGKTNKSIYNQFGYQFGFTVANQGGRDFLFSIALDKADLSKNVLGSAGNRTDGYELNTLDKSKLAINVAKFFDINTHRVGVKYNYVKDKKRGTEIYYTNNDKVLEKLLEKQNYNWDNLYHQFSGYYEFKNDKNKVVLTPFYRYQKMDEHVAEIDKQQHFKYTFVGLDASYSRYLTANSMFSIQPHVVFRQTTTHSAKLVDASTNTSIKNWLENDYAYLSANYTDIGIEAMYSFRVGKVPPMYISSSYSQIQFNNSKQNKYINVSVGITF